MIMLREWVCRYILFTFNRANITYFWAVCVSLLCFLNYVSMGNVAVCCCYSKSQIKLNFFPFFSCYLCNTSCEAKYFQFTATVWEMDMYNIISSKAILKLLFWRFLIFQKSRKSNIINSHLPSVIVRFMCQLGWIMVLRYLAKLILDVSVKVFLDEINI